ncbi:MAG: PASTA domain-containing protein [Bacteroidales bacterium]|nr:MAG: PASTA domain-containing protein [Bacteroidales bacterium]
MSIKKEILVRVALVYLIFVLLGFAIIAKIIYIQVVEGNKWREVAKTITFKDITIEPNRGDIFSYDGRVLATSVPYFEIRMDLKAAGLTNEVFGEKIDSLAMCLSKFYGDKSAKAYRSELVNARKSGRNRRFFEIGNREIDYVELQKVKKFPLFRLGLNKGGFIPVQINRRILPHQTLAQRTIGNVNDGGVAVGIEGAYNYALKGKTGVSLLQRVPGNTWIDVNSPNQVDPEDGLDVVTTIDVDLQDLAENALHKQLEKHGAGWGTVILMEVKTGEIKAIANLKRDEDGVYSEAYNYAIGESAEPGSTFKTAALICLLEDGYVNLEDIVNTGKGKLQIYNHTLTDSHEEGYGKLSVRQIFEVSSNVGVAKLMLQYYKGKEKDFIDRLYKMKLNQPIGLEIDGEVAPNIKYPGDKYWSGLSLPQMSIGYEVKLTPLQILTFYNAIANDGTMVKPHLIKALLNHGETIQTFGTEVICSSICSNSTLEKVRDVLEGVVRVGTAKNLSTNRYKIAGKTGTAQVAKGKKGYKSGGVSYRASFAGYFPADDPKYSCIVVVNSPSKSVYYGNVVAGPIFKEISDKVFATSSEWFPTVKDVELTDMPTSKNGYKLHIEEVLDELDIPVKNNSKKSNWVSVIRADEEVELNDKNVIKNLVPDVKGMCMKDALFLLENAGLRVQVKGKGVVKSQSITAGSKAGRGQSILLEMGTS